MQGTIDYIDSSEDEQKTQNKQIIKATKQSIYLSDEDFQEELIAIIKRKTQKEYNYNGLMVQCCAKEIQENLKQRNQKYTYFIRKMEIDQQYRQKMRKKVQKIAKKNKKKQQITMQQKQNEKYRKEAELVQKYFTEKQSRQHKLRKYIKQEVRKGGIKEIISLKEIIKSKLSNKQKLIQHSMTSLNNQQSHQLSQLKQRYQQLKEDKRVNKLQSQKVLKQMAKSNQQYRQMLSIVTGKKERNFKL